MDPPTFDDRDDHHQQAAAEAVTIITEKINQIRLWFDGKKITHTNMVIIFNDGDHHHHSW